MKKKSRVPLPLPTPIYRITTKRLCERGHFEGLTCEGFISMVYSRVEPICVTLPAGPTIPSQ